MNEGQWLSAPMECDLCSYEWVALYPVEAEYLECSRCGHMTPSPAHPDAELEDFQE